MKKMMKILALVAGLVPTFAFAAWPAGQYTVAFYGDKTSGSGTQGICIVSDGTWYGTTFSGWSGKWFLKGNELHMHGNYAAGAGNDAFELNRIANALATGYWQEWRDDSSYDNYVTVKFSKTSDTCASAASTEINSAANPAN